MKNNDSMTSKASASESVSESRLERKRQINRLSAQRKCIREKDTMKVLSEKYNELIVNRKMLDIESDKLKHLITLLKNTASPKEQTDAILENVMNDNTKTTADVVDFVASSLLDLSNHGKCGIEIGKKSPKRSAHETDRPNDYPQTSQTRTIAQFQEEMLNHREASQLMNTAKRLRTLNDDQKSESSTSTVHAVEGNMLSFRNQTFDTTSSLTHGNVGKTSPPSLENSSYSNTSLSSESTSSQGGNINFCKISHDHSQMISNMVFLSQNDKDTKGVRSNAVASSPSSSSKPSEKTNPYHLYFSKLGKASDDIRCPDEKFLIPSQKITTSFTKPNRYSPIVQAHGNNNITSGLHQDICIQNHRLNHIQEPGQSSNSKEETAQQDSQKQDVCN